VSLELRVLGALEVWHDGSLVDIRAPKHRQLLTLLATRPNKPVSLQTLVDELWEGEAPRTADSALRTYIKSVRRAIDPGRDAGKLRLPLTPSGYALCVVPHELDSMRFEELVDAGSRSNQLGDPRGAEHRLVAALALWRGSPLADAHGLSAVTVELGRLYGLRVRAFEELGEARLRLGRPDAVIELLGDAICEFPHHETFAEQLMLALYRSGRQAEALQTFNDLAGGLGERGLRPSARLRQLEVDILLQQPHLELARESDGAGATMTRTSHARPVGRREELRQLLDAHARAAGGERGFVLLSGPAGIGKTTLASEFCARARRLGAPVIEVACRSDDGGGYEALGAMLGAMRAELGTDAISDVAQLCQIARQCEAPAKAEFESTQLRLFEAMASAIRGLGDRPVVMLVEDLHWAGSSTLPFAVWKTIVSTSPLWALNWLPRRSTTCWASVPGRLKSVEYWRPTVPAITVVSTATRTHPPITHRR